MFDLIKYPKRTVRRSWDRLLGTVTGDIHQRELERRFPGVSRALRTPSEISSKVRQLYAEYVREVSTEGMAMSLETGLFLLSLCEVLQPRRLLDLGSGLSSVLFRLFASQHPGSRVCSVDDNSQWLEATGRYLRAKGLDDSHVVHWNRFSQEDFGTFDLIFHDLGGETRILALDRVIALAKEGNSVAVFDDTHRRRYRRILQKHLSSHECSVQDTRFCTLDSFGRWSLLVDFGYRQSTCQACPPAVAAEGKSLDAA